MFSQDNKLNLQNLTDEEKIALFGEPTKYTKALGFVKKKEEIKISSVKEKSFKQKDSNFQNLINKIDDQQIEEKSTKSWYENLQISENNSLKSLFDVIILILIAYNCVTTFYE